MSLSYAVRLLFLCSAIFFAAHILIGLTVRAITPFFLGLARKLQPRTASRYLLAVRFLPVGLAAFIVLGLCVPSYLWLEPGATTEEVSFVCVLAAFLGIFLWALSFSRAFRAILETRRFARACLKIGREQRFFTDSSSVLVLDSDAPILAMAGVIRPRLVISKSVLSALSPDQLEAAILHERAHRTSADNFKRLLLLLAPEVIPFVSISSTLDHAWRTVSEWAADDSAVQCDPNRSLSLASALVRVAQMGASPRMSPLCTALVSTGATSEESDFSDRVNRLLHPASVPNSTPRRWTAIAASGAITLVIVLMFEIIRPSTLHSVHQALERLTH